MPSVHGDIYQGLFFKACLPVRQGGTVTTPLLCLGYTQHSTAQDALKTCMLKKMTGEDVVPRPSTCLACSRPWVQSQYYQKEKKKKGNKRFIMETTLKPFILKISQYKMSTHTDAAVTL